MPGSTRTGRAGERVARWVLEQAQKRGDADYDLIDLAGVDLPQIDEPFPLPWAATPTRTPGSGPRPSPPTTATCSSPPSTTAPSPAS
ncbi:NADPH-dependent FMN reductase [Streptomyces sparsogenes]